jgi:diguanylate cyclase (GGDEF)-like protein
VADPTASDPQAAEAPLSQHLTSGLTSRLILAYVEREGGAAAVREVLERCGSAHEEERLRDETAWFDFDLKLRLFEAAAAVLGDPHAARHVGEAAIEINAFTGLKLALRTFGAPRMVYANIASTCSKFTWAHSIEVDELTAHFARLRYTDISGVGYHRIDCEYTIGLFACVPEMFGRLPARVRHVECGVEGASACVYEVSWEPEETPVRRIATQWGAASAAALGAAALAPGGVKLRHAIGVPAIGGALVARRLLQARRQHDHSLESEVRDQKEVAERLSASLRDMVSDLRLDEVLDKILSNAQGAVTGREFALLISDAQGFHCRSSSRVPADSLERLERWAAATPDLLERPVTLDDLSGVPILEALPQSQQAPLGALHAVPLIFRHSRLGVLVGLAHGADAFVSQETGVLDAYADQAAIALANARLFERLESLARTDSLTGLLNHGEFQTTLARELERAERYGRGLAVLMLDLEDFRRVNAEHGHAEGDRVLRDVARVLSGACEKMGSSSAYRIGGDEFAVLLPGRTGPEAAAVGEDLRRRVDVLGADIGISYGTAEWPEDGPSQGLLLFNADRALYQAKADQEGIGGQAAALRAPTAPHLDAPAAPDPAPDAEHLRTVTTALARAVDAKDASTRSHSETVSDTCALIAEELGFGSERVARMRLAGLLHDVGKIGVADAILLKPGPLTVDEFEIMKTHATLGYSIVSGAGVEEEAEWILRHHERPDGTGYPDGLRGEEVPLESRIILVADAFEAMTADRPYRRGRPVPEALGELDRMRGAQFDPHCVAALRRVLSSGGRRLFEHSSEQVAPSA